MGRTTAISSPSADLNTYASANGHGRNLNAITTTDRHAFAAAYRDGDA
jgi:hypothetical protein